MNPPSSLSLFTKCGFYCVQYLDCDGRRRQKSLRTKKKTTAIRLAAESNRVLKEKPKPILFSKFKQEFLSSRQGSLSLVTLDIYRRAFTAFSRLVGDPPLIKMTPKKWDLYASKRLQNHCKPVTVNIELRCFRASLSTAVRWHYLETNPFFSSKAGPSR